MKRLLCLLLLPLLATAQTPPATPAPQLPPTVEPTVDPGLAAANPANPANPNAEEMVDLNFPDAQIADILLNYERLSGKRLIKDANLAGQNMSIVVPGKVPKSEAVSIIKATLLLNNYALVPYGDNQEKILNITTGKSPRSEGLKVYASPASLPTGDEVITYYMPFKYLDSNEALQTMQAQATGSHPYAIYLRVPSTQALLITENTSVIRQLLEIQELIDVPPAKIVSEFVSLQRADAERVAETINKMIETQNSSQGGGTAPRNPGAPPPPPPPGGDNAPVYAAGSDSSPNSLFSGQVQLVPDTRTNRILVIARPTSFPYVKSLILSFDQAADMSEPLEVPLRYVTAVEILPVLTTLLTEDSKDANGAGGGVQTPATQPNQNRNYSNNNNSNGGASGSGGTSGTLTHQDNLGTPDQDAGPQSQIVGKTRIIADNKTNSILVIGPPESLAKCRSIISRLDKKPQQVYLSAVIGQLTLKNDQEIGINFLQRFTGQQSGVASSTLNTTSSFTSSLLDPSTLADVTKFPSSGGLSVYGALGDSLNYYVQALESTNRFKILARPVVYTANNKKAVISSGQRIAYPRSTLTDNNVNATNGTSVSASIDYEDVVLQLAVIPLINANNEVTLQIDQVNDSVIGNQTISGQTVPTIGTQEIQTTVTVANKNTVVLGGLITDSKTKDKSGIPVLSSIPLLGNFFKSNSTKYEKDELLVFIQPNVVVTNEDAVRESAGEELRTEVAPSARKMSEDPSAAPTPLPVPKVKIFQP